MCMCIKIDFCVIWYLVSTINYKSTDAKEKTGNVTNTENERGTDKYPSLIMVVSSITC